MTLTDKKKKEMAKNLAKAYNRKIKKALEYINNFLAERETTDKHLPILLSDIVQIKEILEGEKWQSKLRYSLSNQVSQYIVI